MSKQQNQPDAGHHPSTVAEIERVERENATLDLELCEEGRQLYEASRKAGPPAVHLSEHDRRVGKYLEKYMNGTTALRLVSP